MVQKVIIGLKIKLRMDKNVVIMSNITTIVFGIKFNQKIELESLPSNLTNINFR